MNGGSHINSINDMDHLKKGMLDGNGNILDGISMMSSKNMKMNYGPMQWINFAHKEMIKGGDMVHTS